MIIGHSSHFTIASSDAQVIHGLKGDTRIIRALLSPVYLLNTPYTLLRLDMTPRHRPYRPKTKGLHAHPQLERGLTQIDKVLGCYECSQRRVSCDRATPKCAKCVSKGLDCSGLDRRYRFTEGVAIRGKWAGESVQSLYQRYSNCCFPPYAATFDSSPP